MRLINADKIHPDVRTQHGMLAISQGQLAYAPTVDAVPMSVIEDIKNDIRHIVDEESEVDEKWARGLHYALKIIDKHTKGE